jgi:hypothetical protein
MVFRRRNLASKAIAVSEAATSKGMKDRRSGRRYALSLPLTFKVFRRRLLILCGTGKLHDISSRGAAFTNEYSLALGTSVELSVAWPALLYGVTNMKLVISGTVVRSCGGVTALEIDRYEFRTQKRQ